jgi:hypothetical protein
MAATKVSDIIIPDVWVPYVIQRTMEKSALIQSGIVVPNAVFDELARKGGNLINMPYFSDLSGDDEVLSDSLALSPGAIGTAQDVAVLHMRGRAWGVNDLAKALSGDDPMSAIADLVASYWNRREQALLFATLKGIFTTALASTHVKDVAVEAGASATEDNLIGGTVVIDAATLLGDEAEGLTAMAMHSVPFSRLQKLSLIEYVELDSNGKRVEAKSAETITVPMFLGKRVIVDDTCPKVAGSTSGYKYTTYLFGPGAIARGEGNAPVPVETDRDSLAGEDYLIHRRHFVLHPRGVKYNKASQAGQAPTNAECETGSNWTKVWEAKAIRIVKLVTNG